MTALLIAFPGAATVDDGAGLFVCGGVSETVVLLDLAAADGSSPSASTRATAVENGNVRPVAPHLVDCHSVKYGTIFSNAENCFVKTGQNS